MKNLLLFIVLAFVASSCATKATTTSTDKPKKDSKFTNYAHYKYTFTLQKPVTSDELKFKDNTIGISFNITQKEVLFDIANQTDGVLKVNWDDTALILGGNSKKTIHKGVKYIDRSGAQPMSVIPPQSKISDFVVPTENVKFSQGVAVGYVSTSSKWVTADLFPNYNYGKTALDDLIKSNDGTKFSLYLPIIKADKQIDYIFEFQVKVEPVTKK